MVAVDESEFNELKQVVIDLQNKLNQVVSNFPSKFSLNK